MAHILQETHLGALRFLGTTQCLSELVVLLLEHAHGTAAQQQIRHQTDDDKQHRNEHRHHNGGASACERLQAAHLSIMQLLFRFTLLHHSAQVLNRQFFVVELQLAFLRCYALHLDDAALLFERQTRVVQLQLITAQLQLGILHLQQVVADVGISAGKVGFALVGMKLLQQAVRLVFILKRFGGVAAHHLHLAHPSIASVVLGDVLCNQHSPVVFAYV